MTIARATTEETRIEIEHALLTRYSDADSVEITTYPSANGFNDVYWACVMFVHDYDINYMVADYSGEYLDFFKFKFSAERDQVGKDVV